MIIPAPERPNQKWSMDFVSDITVTGATLPSFDVRG